MKLHRLACIAAITGALALAACQDRTPEAAPAAGAGSPAGSAPAPVPAPATDAWLGQWNGPEGTYLQLAGSGGEYEVTIRNLDGPRTFPGKAVGERIEFERDGVKESLRATNGAETGMKWLSEKKNCVTVRAGEGYCRDS
jgi:hypothetical protein